MPRLDCSVKTCYYNKESRCCREGIHVEGADAQVARSTECGSFRARKMDQTDNSCGCPSSPEQCLEVKCDAVRCIYNANCVCSAEHIGIAGNGADHAKDTECASFVNERA